MPEVKFLKQWRGHAEGEVVKLTDERAAELCAIKYCCLTADLLPPEPPKRGPGRPRKILPTPKPEPTPDE